MKEGSLAFFQGLRHYAPVLETEVLGNPLWNYLGFFIWLVLGCFLISKAREIVEARAGGWLKSYHDSFQIRLIKRLIMPFRLFLLIILIFEGFEFFALLSRESARWHGQLYALAMGFCATVALSRLVEVILWQWKRNHRQSFKEDINGQLYLLVDKGTQLFVMVIMALTTLHNMGINITSLLTSLSIGSLALALAAQDTLSNLFGAVSILADNTFRIGHRIKIDNIEGTVENIGMRSTQIRDLEDRLVTIPNKSLALATIVNVSERQLWKATSTIDLAHDMTYLQIARACSIIEEIYRSDSRVEQVSVGLKIFTERAFRLEINHAIRIALSQEQLELFHKFNLKIKERFEQEGIRLALEAPTQVAMNELIKYMPKNQ